MSHQRDRIERGWQLLEAGDLAGAEAALRRAQQGGSDGADVLCLAGAVASARGEIDDALDLLARAAAADPEDPHPLLQAGELELYSRGDPKAAIAMAGRALALTDEDEERADVLLLRAEAEFQLEDEKAALAAAADTMAMVEELEIADPVLLTRAAQMYLDLDRWDDAERGYLAAVEEDPSQADAHHGLGLVYERRGDREAMIRAWTDTRRLDELAPPPPWHLSLDEFEKVAEAAMAELPPEVLSRLENVPVLIADLPDEHLVEEGYDPRLLGLFSGVPLPGKSHATNQVAVIDAVHLYQKNLERESADREQLVEEIRVTVLHETAHFFGLEDDDLDSLGLG
ncbi:MAG TPA: metallopeptidase family protein [Kofleriaceae bacterium]|nr:metallopeptidase family protein [Kofleriaceae bacterium]